MRILITGGAGFIGSTLVRHILHHSEHEVVNVDLLTYAGDHINLESIADDERYAFEHADICDRSELARIFEQYQPDGVMHLAAESHVDRSIDGPDVFVQTNVNGTCTLLGCAMEYWKNLNEVKKSSFRFLHVSTDEVYGSLKLEDDSFTEETPLRPNSPYSVSKASGDQFVQAWHHTFGLPTIIVRPSNNYGPNQFPEKLIPTVILSALEKREIPVYGTGENVRDWLYCDDHVRALLLALTEGEVGQQYNIGSDMERTNLEVVHAICSLVDGLLGHVDSVGLIKYVTDRPGHDMRYSIDATKFKKLTGWTPQSDFKKGIEETVRWYLENDAWITHMRNKGFNNTRKGLGNCCDD